jgi:hypothetical protein
MLKNGFENILIFEENRIYGREDNTDSSSNDRRDGKRD